MRLRTGLFILFLALCIGPQITIQAIIGVNGFNIPLDFVRFPSDIGVALLAVLYFIVDDKEKSREEEERKKEK